MSDYTKSDNVMNALRLKSELEGSINKLISEYEGVTGLSVTEIELILINIPSTAGGKPFAVAGRGVSIRVEL